MADNSKNSEVDALRHSLVDYLASSKYSDLVIRCKGQDFNVHKVVLCGQSKFFSKACDGEWKEGAEGVIDLKDDDVQVVEAMLQFLYATDYDSNKIVSPMLFNIRVYVLADKYDIEPLKKLAKAKFEKAMWSCWKMDDFPDAVAEVYGSTMPTDRSLRGPVAEVSYENLQQLLKDDGFGATLEQTVGFAADVIRLGAAEQKGQPAQGGNSALKKYLCPDCDRSWEGVLVPSRAEYCCLRCGDARSDWNKYVQR
ncbi:MAG: hypothetical protein M1816_000787 [Peltula sp. TS41687]|nr:MAG: hypothetical protein M1816_000787 [Peltula sp. TS41687]